MAKKYPPKHKIIDGKKYKLWRTSSKKSIAGDFAKSIRKDGHSTRVVTKKGYKYGVYVLEK